MSPSRRLAGPLLAVIVTATAVAGCAEDGVATRATTYTDLEPSTTSVTYSYIGSSTAPEYHDEYVVTIADGSASAARGSYGVVEGRADPRTAKTTAVTGDQWQKMMSALDTLPARVDSAPGCAGGSTYAVEVKDAGRSVLDRTDYVCGSDADDRVTAAYDAFIDPIATPLGLR